jgi:nucleotide-binding universal stress UspA family protein
VCPVDFSDASRSALRYAAAIADHRGARLLILTVVDPLLVEAAKTAGAVPSLTVETERELRRFCEETIPDFSKGPKSVAFRVAIGKPAAEILRESIAANADLIVISSQGRTGVRKAFFGSTTDHVLRETPVPVLVTPAGRAPANSATEIAQTIKRVVVPVDLSDASTAQATAAASIARALSVPIIITHVMEPIYVPMSVRVAIPGVEAHRRVQVEEELARITGSLRPHIAVESIVLTGDPSEEIVALAEARQAGLILMGLHSSGLLGPRMGSVTYRVLCQTRALVLAIPPRPSSQSRAVRDSRANASAAT